MKLHYSQTKCAIHIHHYKVLLPYEITLLSNWQKIPVFAGAVLLPYEITLLSNFLREQTHDAVVLLPYEITLLSNYDPGVQAPRGRFTTL